MASEDAVYRESSQFRLWSFSPSQLETLREQTNALAHESIEERRRETSNGANGNGNGSGNGSGSGSNGEDDKGTPSGSGSTVVYLTPAEEKMLLDFYTVELLRAAKFTEQPTDVQATAAVFFRRFYITHSIMTYPPAQLFKTALFFGAKSEGYYHKLDGFAEKFPNTTAADILAGEFLLCQGIRFSFDVKHPFRALEGAVMELRRLVDVDDQTRNAANDEEEISDSRVSNAHRRAREILKFSPLVTDAYFHYSPSQIMFAALWLADRALVERLLLGETFHRPASLGAAAADVATPILPGGGSASKKKKTEAADWERVNGAGVRDRVLGTIQRCSELLATEPPERFTEYWGQPESNNIIKPLLKKLKLCRDPDRFNLVALQQAKKAGAVKSYAKTSTHVAGGMDDDAAVFGKTLGTISGAGTGTNTPDSLHEAKRRKVAKQEDPFGPPLK
ncbi:cyclin H [Sporothrix schenckii 1099-18]|uniref:Cyclin H n=1 Tax=Sporothrix schenckii 1099-18 TaxID=1397361 RepID=A0A0F2M9X8_SPOSC|nr:cyclin H [Sporothrix schenckii 1099-18]KJR84956.1 cyclin H [Sporothrix schenckii 1099-18]